VGPFPAKDGIVKYERPPSKTLKVPALAGTKGQYISASSISNQKKLYFTYSEEHKPFHLENRFLELLEIG
jgi:hypothetical protein